MSTHVLPFIVMTRLFKTTKKAIFPVIVLSFCAFSLFAQENADVLNGNDNAAPSEKIITAPGLKVPISSVSQLLGGRVAGIISMQAANKTKPDGTEVYINCSCSSSALLSSALVLIDGVEGAIDHVRPEDVESFSILKDASATAMYGERGANGVVLITTKNGGKISVESETDTATTEMESLAAPDLDTTQLENETVSAIKTDIDPTETDDSFPDLKIYPNPFSGTLQLTGAENCILRVLSEDGVVVHTQKLVNPIETIPLEHLRAGVYFFSVNNGKQTKMVKGIKSK